MVFNNNQARILVNPENASDLRRQKNVFEDPDLESLRGIPPHKWELGNGYIKSGNLKVYKKGTPSAKALDKKQIAYFILSFIAGILIHYIVRS